MKATIDVSSREEGDQLRLGLADERVRAFVRIIGVLGQLTTDRQRDRVLRFVSESLNDHATLPEDSSL